MEAKALERLVVSACPSCGVGCSRRIGYLCAPYCQLHGRRYRIRAAAINALHGSIFQGKYAPAPHSGLGLAGSARCAGSVPGVVLFLVCRALFFFHLLFLFRHHGLQASIGMNMELLGAIIQPEASG